MNATYISGNEVRLSWLLPRGDYTDFEVQYLTAENILNQKITSEPSIKLNLLKPHRNYTFTVTVRSGTESSILRRSTPISDTFTTEEAAPGKVETFTPVDVQPGEVTFKWSLPQSEQNGIIRKFTITYGLEGSTHTLQKDFSPLEFTGQIKQLIPGRTYVFIIQAETRIGYGENSTFILKMPILAPPKPSVQVVPTEVCKSSTTIQIRFRKNYFSEQNGPVSIILLKYTQTIRISNR